MEIDLHFNRRSSSHLNTYKVRILGTLVFKTLSYLERIITSIEKNSNQIHVRFKFLGINLFNSF